MFMKVLNFVLMSDISACKFIFLQPFSVWKSLLISSREGVGDHISMILLPKKNGKQNWMKKTLRRFLTKFDWKYWILMRFLSFWRQKFDFSSTMTSDDDSESDDQQNGGYLVRIFWNFERRKQCYEKFYEKV